MRDEERQFSVIIPTLQRSPILEEVVLRCARNPLVLEILVINNAPDPVPFTHPRMRVLQQDQNIFVNPAWNLGVREAAGSLIAIVNDDVLFEDEAFSHAACILRRGFFGIVGPDLSAYHDDSTRRISHRLARHDATTRWFGTFMCLRRKDYVPIPDELEIWGGDDWLILNQRRPPASLIRTRFSTDMSTTSRAEEFRQRFDSEQRELARLLAPVHGTRWWHRAQHIHGLVRNRLHLLTGR